MHPPLTTSTLSQPLPSHPLSTLLTSLHPLPLPPPLSTPTLSQPLPPIPTPLPPGAGLDHWSSCERRGRRDGARLVHPRRNQHGTSTSQRYGTPTALTLYVVSMYPIMSNLLQKRSIIDLTVSHHLLP